MQWRPVISKAGTKRNKELWGLKTSDGVTLLCYPDSWPYGGVVTWRPRWLLQSTTSSWFWSCSWHSKQTHHQTTADLSHTVITTILHAISPDLCPTEPYQLWASTDDLITFNIFYISMILCWIVQLQREPDIKGHICKVSQRFGFSSSSKRALQSDLQTERMFSCWSFKSADSGRPSHEIQKETSLCWLSALIWDSSC